MKPGPLSFAACFALFAFCSLLDTKPTIAQVHDQVDAVREQLVRTEQQLEHSRTETERNSEIRDLDDKIAELERSSVQKKNELARIEQRQLVSIRRWLLNKYPDAVVHGNASDRRIIVTTTLFGTFVADYPAALPPKAPAEINVIFAPAVFQEDLWPKDVSLGISGYSSDIVRHISLKEMFELGNVIAVNERQPIRWTWTMRSPRDFTGVSLLLEPWFIMFLTTVTLATKTCQLSYQSRSAFCRSRPLGGN